MAIFSDLDTGTHRDKLARLQERADYWIAEQFAVPERFHIRIGEETSETVQPVFTVPFHQASPSLGLFEDTIQPLADRLPGFCPFAIREDPISASGRLDGCADYTHMLP
jgi:hypothetical protein